MGECTFQKPKRSQPGGKREWSAPVCVRVSCSKCQHVEGEARLETSRDLLLRALRFWDSYSIFWGWGERIGQRQARRQEDGRGYQLR